MFPSYSPLFTLGLLAQPSPVPSSSRSQPSLEGADAASAIYFTLQTSQWDTVEAPSFLYLDLADHKCPLPSHRRKNSALSKSTSWACLTDARTEKPMMIPSTPVVPVTRRRASKESMRSIPSPKPAPSATLPDLPAFLPVSSPSPAVALPKKRAVSTIVASPLSPTFSSRRSVSLRSESVSSLDRRKSRMDALACLEGRSRAPNRVPRASSLRNNFMSFSDDEDERSTSKVAVSKPTTTAVHADDPSGFADVEDEADAIMPTLARKREAGAHAKPARPVRPTWKRRSTIESWFPLKSFIDLKDDDLSSWNWRSFIEIGGVA